MGERATARILAPLAAVGSVVLHDRRIPGTTANIDHLVISRHTVHVIDSKVYRGRVFVDAHGALMLGSVPLQEKVDRVRWMTEEVLSRVTLHLASAWMTVRGALCIHDARLPRPIFRWDGIDIVQPDELLRLVAIDVSGCPGPAADVVGAIVQAFPPALTNHSSTQEVS